jgi:hypothetical protein
MIPREMHEYEKIVERGLQSISSGPWTTADLETVRQVMDEDWCEVHAPDCTSSDLLRWLDSLDEDQTEELLFHANTDWNAGQDPWALS